VQFGLAGLDHEQVAGLLLLDEEADVAALGVECVRCDGDPGQAGGLRQRREAGDLIVLSGTRSWVTVWPSPVIAARRWAAGEVSCQRQSRHVVQDRRLDQADGGRLAAHRSSDDGAVVLRRV
jgi:hypothetical protein